jgi:hypothetical protein
MPPQGPKFIAPMLLLRTEKLPESNAWLCELKFDGSEPSCSSLPAVHLRPQ